MSASLEVITGCMKSGKSEEFMRRISRAKILQLDTIIVKPMRDTRVKAQICSRNGICIDAIEIETPEQLLTLVEDRHAIVGIDEAQFFPESLVAVVSKLVHERKKRVIVSGLNLDFRAEPFPVMAKLLALATEVHVVKAICEACRKADAFRSQKIGGSAEIIEIGDVQYEPRCLECFVLP